MISTFYLLLLISNISQNSVSIKCNSMLDVLILRKLIAHSSSSCFRRWSCPLSVFFKNYFQHQTELLQPENRLKVGRSLRLRDEGEHEENPCTKVQVYIDLLKMSLPLALYNTRPSFSLSLSQWMVFFVFCSKTQSPTD